MEGSVLHPKNIDCERDAIDFNLSICSIALQGTTFSVRSFSCNLAVSVPIFDDDEKLSVIVSG
jgi:hypothetical protein